MAYTLSQVQTEIKTSELFWTTPFKSDLQVAHDILLPEVQLLRLDLDVNPLDFFKSRKSCTFKNLSFIQPP